jgi:two-component system, LytTR family, response regulator
MKLKLPRFTGKEEPGFDPRARLGGTLLVKRRDRAFLVRAADIDWVEAKGDYVLLHVDGQTHVVRATLADMELRLKAAGFARIHRSRLVNWTRVQQLALEDAQPCMVVLRDGQRLLASQNYLKMLQPYFSGAG